jgi:hypothetical protein
MPKRPDALLPTLGDTGSGIASRKNLTKLQKFSIFTVLINQEGYQKCIQ